MDKKALMDSFVKRGTYTLPNGEGIPLRAVSMRDYIEVMAEFNKGEQSHPRANAMLVRAGCDLFDSRSEEDLDLIFDSMPYTVVIEMVKIINDLSGFGESSEARKKNLKAVTT